jgi:hypothetical protein
MAVIYTENTAAMVELLADTLDKHPDWLRHLRLFRGEVVACPDDSLPEVHGGAPWLSNYVDYAAIGTLGRCATLIACEYQPPLSCYLCAYFRPDPRANHALQLAQVRGEAADRLGHESDRLLGVLKRVDGAIVQVLDKSRAIVAASENTPTARIRADRPRSARIVLIDDTSPSTRRTK